MQELIERAEKLGYKFFFLMFDINECVYWSITLAKDLTAWHPYKGQRNLEHFDAWVVNYWFDEEDTSKLEKGKLIYSSEDADEINCEPYRLIENVRNLPFTTHEWGPEELARLESILTHLEHRDVVEVLEQQVSRWDGAIRN